MGAFFLKNEGGKMKIYQSMFNLISDEEAQGLVEYSLIISLMALVVFGALMVFGGTLLNLYDAIKGEVEKI